MLLESIDIPFSRLGLLIFETVTTLYECLNGHCTSNSVTRKTIHLNILHMLNETLVLKLVMGVEFLRYCYTRRCLKFYLKYNFHHDTEKVVVFILTGTGHDWPEISTFQKRENAETRWSCKGRYVRRNAAVLCCCPRNSCTTYRPPASINMINCAP